MTTGTTAPTIRTTSPALARARRAMLHIRPETPDELDGFCRLALGYVVPRRPRTPGMSAPFDYLAHAFFESTDGPRDCIVWANRGGGKTQLGAVATLLDLIFKPGIEIRILGGSLEQSDKMHTYLRELLERRELRNLVDGRVTDRGARLVNRSAVEVLAQSERSVRGVRVQKLRCDEVELFEPGVWDAAQFVTRSKQCGEVFVRGAVEALSTMHRPFGLMRRLVDDPDGAGRRALFRWGVLETLERCPKSRLCGECPLEVECDGRAKRGRGFFHIDDAIQQRRRASTPAWRSEMLCETPTRSDCVYPEFDEAVHVRPFRANERSPARIRWLGGMDFGFRAPTVFLWAAYDEVADTLHIVDEYVETERTIDTHLEHIARRGRPRPEWLGVDPAGRQRSDQTGVSTISRLCDAGHVVRARRMDLFTSIDLVRARLRAADGAVRLFIDPRCRALIEALTEYHFAVDDERSETPVKDGPDHACDALRYLITNLDGRRRGATRFRSYIATKGSR
ncbi:MAG: hypothetical protein ACF8PN_05370 [Phycisphaerales bacterium]